MILREPFSLIAAGVILFLLACAYFVTEVSCPKGDAQPCHTEGK